MRFSLRFHLGAALGALALCALASARSQSQTTGQALPSSAVASNSDLRCAARHATSVAVPFQIVELDGHLIERASWLEGFHSTPIRAVVADSIKWPDVWRATADTVPPPSVTFASDALILLATRIYPAGPSSLSVKWIRRCRRTGAIVVASVEQTGIPGGGNTAVLSRGMALVRVPHRELEGARVVFRDLPSK